MNYLLLEKKQYLTVHCAILGVFSQQKMRSIPGVARFVRQTSAVHRLRF